MVSDWIIRSAHAQTDCLQMRSPALSKWQDNVINRDIFESFQLLATTQHWCM